jgi:hypothetical protein
MPKVQVYSGPPGIGLLSAGGPCRNTVTVVFGGVLETTLTVRSFMLKLGASTQFTGLSVSTVFGKVKLFPVPATCSPFVTRLVVIDTVPPARPTPVPMLICANGVLVAVPVDVCVAVGVVVGVFVAVGVDVLVGDGVDVAVSVGVAVAVSVLVGVAVDV